jgi:organic radical activating enzyme
LVEALRLRGIDVEIETAGTLSPSAELARLVTSFNVSPKLSNSGNAVDRRHKPDVLRAFEATGRASFKFVVVVESDLAEIAMVVEECGLSDVWVMPEGTQPESLLERSRVLAGPVADRGWNLTSRLQVLLWKDRRGV